MGADVLRPRCFKISDTYGQVLAIRKPVKNVPRDNLSKFWSALIMVEFTEKKNYFVSIELFLLGLWK